MACYSVECKPHMSHTAIEYDCKDHHISLCFSFVNTLIGGGVIDTVWGQFRLKLVFYLFTRRHLPPSFCRPQTKLWEGTIFTIHRRLSVHKALVKGVGNMHHGIGHMVGYPPQKKRYGSTPNPLDIRPGTPCWWHLVVITGNSFKLLHFGTPQEQHLVVAIETETQAGSMHPIGILPCYYKFGKIFH